LRKIFGTELDQVDGDIFMTAKVGETKEGSDDHLLAKATGAFNKDSCQRYFPKRLHVLWIKGPLVVSLSNLYLHKTRDYQGTRAVLQLPQDKLPRSQPVQEGFFLKAVCKYQTGSTKTRQLDLQLQRQPVCKSGPDCKQV
jgi:hypothetical protein